jgi:hypothetical protein
MAKAKPFSPAKLIFGLIASQDLIFQRTQELLIQLYGPLDTESRFFSFDYTDYYKKQMIGTLKRKFISCSNLYPPDKLSEIKLRTNTLEEEIAREIKSKKRVVNIDPGILSASALIMATVKDFSHRIPMQKGIYGHLEFLFGKNAVKILPWTYPDYRSPEYHDYFLNVRELYLQQVK